MLLIALACVIAALALLGALSVIDLRTRLLPDKLVAPLLLTGIVFHWATGFYYTSGTGMLAGALIGGGLLLAVRFVANHFYQQDALGLGDVKLLAAAGVWLGPHDVLLAVILGAFAGIVHGLGLAVYQRLKTKEKINLRYLALPAGPGFAVGILIAGIIKFSSLFDLFF